MDRLIWSDSIDIALVLAGTVALQLYKRELELRSDSVDSYCPTEVSIVWHFFSRTKNVQAGFSNFDHMTFSS